MAADGRDPTGTAPPVGGRSRAGTAAGTGERAGRVRRTGFAADEHGFRISTSTAEEAWNVPVRPPYPRMSPLWLPK